MSLEALTWAFKQALHPTQKIVLLALADYADDENRCWPAMKTLAEKSSLSERAVRNAIRSLEEVGYLTTEVRTRPNGSQTSNSYWLNLPGGAAYRAGGPSPETTPPEPSSNPQKKTPPTPSSDQSSTDVLFERAWLSWPKKVSKADARKAWPKALGAIHRSAVRGEITYGPEDAAQWTPVALLTDAVTRFGAAYQRNTPPKFIPNLATWLNGERWTDPLPVSEERGRYQAEPPRAAGMVIPRGHRLKRDENGIIIGTEAIE